MIPRDDHSIPNMYSLQKGGCNFYSLAMELIRWQVGPIAIVIQARVWQLGIFQISTCNDLGYLMLLG